MGRKPLFLFTTGAEKIPKRTRAWVQNPGPLKYELDLSDLDQYLPPKKKGKQGLASMTPERRKEISRLGGKSIPPHMRPFAKDKELARRAGRKGGMGQEPEQRTFSTDRELAKRARQLSPVSKPGGVKPGR